MSDYLNERLNKILPRLIADDFLSGSGLGNEIAFHIFEYPPEDELRVRDFLPTLLDHLAKQKPDLKFRHVNLFDFVIDHLQGRGYPKPSLTTARPLNSNPATLRRITSEQEPMSGQVNTTVPFPIATEQLR